MAQAFEAKKDGITLKIIPYSTEDKKYSPRLVKTIEPKGISLDKLITELKELI